MSGSLMTPPYQTAAYYSSWSQPDPLPTLFQAHFRSGSGAAQAVQGTKWLSTFNEIYVAWIPPDPLPTIPVTLGKNTVTTKSGPVTPPLPAPSQGDTFGVQHINAFGAQPVYVVPNNVYGAVVPMPGLATQIAVAGVAVIAATGPISGGFLLNPANATAQGIATAENLYVDIVYPPGSTDAAAYGTTTLLTPGQTFTIPALAGGINIWANAATLGHRFTIVVW